MFPNYSSTFPKYIISKIYKELVQFNRKKEISVWKMSEEPEYIFEEKTTKWTTEIWKGVHYH